MSIYSTCRPHPCSREHAELVEEYRLAVEAQNLRAESITKGYSTEVDEYWRTVEHRFTFKEWLIGHRGER